MSTFVKNPKTGQVLRSNRILDKRPDLIPCDKDGKAFGPDEYISIPEPVQPVILRQEEIQLEVPTIVESSTTDLETKKKEGEQLVKEWFGRDVSRVTITNLRDFADEKEIKLPDSGTKLDLVFLVKEGLEAKED